MSRMATQKVVVEAESDQVKLIAVDVTLPKAER